MLGESLKQLRLFYGVKQKDLAQRLSVSQSYLSEIENETKHNIPLNLLDKYSQIFDIEPSSLLLFSERMHEGAGNLRINRNAARKILNIMKWISEKKDFDDDAIEETI